MDYNGLVVQESVSTSLSLFPTFTNYESETNFGKQSTNKKI
jgi:hypothetical protein